MTTGALIFAFNNEATDYVKLAAWSAERIRRFLDIPVAVVTNDPGAQGFDRVIVAQPSTGGTRHFEDHGQRVSWHNASRVDAYDLSPWDRTLLLDADYVINSSDLALLLAYDLDIMLHDRALDVTGRSMHGHATYGRHALPMSWATVMTWRRSAMAGYVFGMMQMIRDNWSHYRELYGINQATYRNDYAVSMALQLVNGCTTHVSAIPWSLWSVMPDTELEQVSDTDWRCTWCTSQGAFRATGFNGLDFHAMGKSHLEAVIEAA